MKAERRHELKTNTLAENLAKAPAFFQKYGSRILLGVLVVLLAIILTQRYIADKKETAQQAAMGVSDGWVAVNEMNRMPLESNPAKAVEEVEKHITPDALKNSTDPKILASAALIRGEANLKAAGATTQPSAGFLQKAADAYADVLKPPLDSDHAAVTSARLGLAAVAENREQLDDAAKYYNLVINDSATDPAYIAYARERVKALDTLKKPIYLSKVMAAPASQPTSH